MPNTITEGRDRELAPDAEGEIKRGPTAALDDLKSEINRAGTLRQEGYAGEARGLSSIESRSHLRVAAANELEPSTQGVQAALDVDQKTAKNWADLDVADFGRMRSPGRKEDALESIAANMRASADYAAEIEIRSPALASAAMHLNEERAKLEEQARLEALEAHKRNENAARATERQVVLDAAALALLHKVRHVQTEAAAHGLGLRDAPERRDDIQAVGAKTDSARVEPGLSAQEQGTPKALKRPIDENELSEALRTRYIVTSENKGLLNKGRTEFTVRSGEDQGKVAFVDAGKNLSTTREDKETVRNMIEVAVTKGWTQVTLDGTDEFKRAAWLEAKLNNLEVKGFTPREADTQMLAALVATKQNPGNSISLTGRDIQRSTAGDGFRVSDSVSHGKRERGPQINGDELTTQEKAVLASAEARTEKFGPKFQEAVNRELAARLKGERVHVGVLVEHGSAPYKHDKNNDQSYYAILKTPQGEKTVWGKEIGKALEAAGLDRGDSVVLKNVGKEAVTVKAKEFDAAGRLVSITDKGTDRNAWKAEPLERYSEKAKADALDRQKGYTPTLATAPQRITPEQNRAAPGRER